MPFTGADATNLRKIAESQKEIAESLKSIAESLELMYIEMIKED